MAKDIQQFCFRFVAAEREVEFFVTIKTDDVGEKSDLRFGPVTMGAVDLAVDVTGVDEEDFVFAGRLALAAVQEPERAGKRNRVEHIRPDGDHYIYRVRFNELFSKFLLRSTRVCRQS